jgi:hypothetical protein
MQCLDVAQGLEYLHGEDIIHGNITGVSVTMNVMIGISDSDLMLA